MAVEDPDDNPYAPPRTELSNNELTDFHKIISARVSYREFWRMRSNPLQFLIMAALKTLRVRIPFKAALPYPRSINPVDRDQVPAYVQKHWEAPLAECEAMGLKFEICYANPSIGITKEFLTALLGSDDGLLTVGLNYWRFETELFVKEKVIISAASRLDNDRRALLRNDRAYLDGPPEVLIRSTRKRTVAEVVAQHRRWLDRRGWKPISSPDDDLVARILEAEQASIAFLVGRGVLVPMTVSEVERFNKTVIPGVDMNRASTRLLKILRVVGLWLWIAGVASFLFLTVDPSPKLHQEISTILSLIAAVGVLGAAVFGLIIIVMIRLARRKT